MKKEMVVLGLGRDIMGLAQAVSAHLTGTEKMEAQILTSGDAVVVQGRCTGTFRKLVGMDKAITVKITQVKKSVVTVEIGEGKWIDKAGAAFVSWFVLWPLAVTAIVGSVQQAKVPAGIMKAVRRYVA